MAVAIDAGLAGRVEQDAGGGPAVHRAVVDAAEHDEGAGRVEAERDRQQHRDGQRRADARQHADRGAERHAGERPRQVRQRERAGEAVAERARHARQSMHPRQDRTSSQPAREQPGRQRQLQHAREEQVDAVATRRRRTGRRAPGDARRTRAPSSQNSTADAMTNPARSASSRFSTTPAAMQRDRRHARPRPRRAPARHRADRRAPPQRAAPNTTRPAEHEQRIRAGGRERAGVARRPCRTSAGSRARAPPPRRRSARRRRPRDSDRASGSARAPRATRRDATIASISRLETLAIRRG